MKIIKYFTTFAAYNILYAILWFKAGEFLFPSFIPVYLLINWVLMDAKRNFLIEFFKLSGLLFTGFIIGFFLKGAYYPLIIQYLLLLPTLSLLIFVLKKYQIKIA